MHGLLLVGGEEGKKGANLLLSDARRVVSIDRRGSVAENNGVVKA